MHGVKEKTGSTSQTASLEFEAEKKKRRDSSITPQVEDLHSWLLKRRLGPSHPSSLLLTRVHYAAATLKGAVVLQASRRIL